MTEQGPNWTWDDVSQAPCDKAVGMVLLLNDSVVLKEIEVWDLRETVRRAAIKRLKQRKLGGIK